MNAAEVTRARELCAAATKGGWFLDADPLLPEALDTLETAVGLLTKMCAQPSAVTAAVPIREQARAFLSAYKGEQ